MVMDTFQVRMNKELIKRIDFLVKKGLYNSRSDVVRDAVRRFVWRGEVGTIGQIGDSVEMVRSTRKKLSKETKKEELEGINAL